MVQRDSLPTTRAWRAARAALLLTTLFAFLLAACDQGSGNETRSARAVTIKLGLSSTGLRAASDVPRVDLLLYACNISEPCTPQDADAAILELDEDGRLTGGECAAEGEGCELVFTPQRPTRTLWLPDGEYALAAAAYLDDSGTPAFCNEPTSFTVSASGDDEVLVAMSDDCSETDLSSDATLKSLTVTENGALLELEPQFDPDVTEYQVQVSAEAETAALALEANDAAAVVIVTIEGDPVTGIAGVYTLTLSASADTIVAITVTAEDDTEKTTTLTVKHAAPTLPGWKKQFGTDGDDTATDLAVDSEGNIYVVGVTTGDFTQFGGLGNPGDCESDCADPFLAKFGSDGVLRWVYQFGSPAAERATRVVLDQDDNILVAGETDGNLGGSTQGGTDIYVLKFPADFDPAEVDAEPLWQYQTGSAGSDKMGAITPAGVNFFLAYISALTPRRPSVELRKLSDHSIVSVITTDESRIEEACVGDVDIHAIHPTNSDFGAVIAGTKHDDGTLWPFIGRTEHNYSFQTLFWGDTCYGPADEVEFGSILYDKSVHNILVAGVTDAPLASESNTVSRPFTWRLDANREPTLGGPVYLAGGADPGPAIPGPENRVANYDRGSQILYVHDADGGERIAATLVGSGSDPETTVNSIAFSGPAAVIVAGEANESIGDDTPAGGLDVFVITYQLPD